MKSTHRFFSVIGISLAFMLVALRLSAAPDGVTRPATQATPVTASATIEPGTDQTMGATGVTLAFDPGASGAVSVTLVPTTPLNPPPGGATARSWFISTTAETFAVTATFGYSQITPVDMVIAFDKSGSMEFDTLCYGCWTPSLTQEYPEGNRWPLRWDGPADGPPAQCAGNDPQTQTIGSDYTFALIEAEEYSNISNIPRHYGYGYTYWVMQRNGNITEPDTDYLGDAGAVGRDTRGAYIGHFPYRVGFVGEPNGDLADPGASGVPCVWEDISNGYMCRRGDWIDERAGGPCPAPRADYVFTVPPSPIGGNTWHLWIRAQGGDPAADPNQGQGVFWGLDGTLRGRGAQNHASGDGDTFKYNGADPAYWTWRRLQLGATGSGGDGNALAPGSTHTLNIWAGSAGFTIDQIVVTNYSGVISDATLSGIARDNNRTDYACSPCDARFGGYPGGPGNDGPPNCNDPNLPEPKRYRYLDPIYDDEQALASATAATARFMRRLDIAQHQIGLVRYSSVADATSELLCLESHGTGCSANVIEDTLVDALMDRSQTYANGSTNIADALEESIKLLESEPPHYGRHDALPVIVLMTDGEADAYSNLDAANADCDAGDLYPGDDAAQECTVYMAHRAHERGILIYAITLGAGADRELMQAIADVTGGIHVHAETPEALDAIFDYLQRYLAAPMRALYHRESAGEPWQMHPLTLTEAAASTFRSALIDLTGKSITSLSEWTLGPLPILMTAQPATLTANGASASTIVATVLQGYYGSELWPAADGVVTFTTSLGTITPITALTAGGVATAALTSGLDAGPVIVTATNGEMTGVVTLAIVAGEPAAVALVAGKTMLVADNYDATILTATVTDEYDHPIANGTPVTFTTSLGETAPQMNVTLNGVATATLAAGMDTGVAAVRAKAGNVGATIAVTFTRSAPHSIAVQAADAALPADGQAATAITATVTDEYGHPVADGAPVTFTTSLGAIAPFSVTTAGGVITATLTASLDVGVATVSATAEGISGTVGVTFVPLAPYSVTVQAHPGKLPADGRATSAITVTVTDRYGRPVADGAPVRFITKSGVIAPLSPTTTGGMVTTTFTAGLTPGPAKVIATADQAQAVIWLDLYTQLYLPLVLRTD